MKVRGINILIAGLGGQGVLLAGDIISRALLNEGYDVKASALRGMAQRGGMMLSHIRAGKKVYSPLIPKGRVDILVALELEECIKQVEYLKKAGSVFFLDRYMPAREAKGRKIKGPHSIIKSLKENFGNRAVQIPYDRALNNSRNVKTLNMFMLGVLSRYLFINKSSWFKSINETFSRNMRDDNLSAFSAGRNLYSTF
ncbi:MAG: indolepyruvate oxidoreductase subunit beta [Candidatus Omnitrophica bacterium]|nr:indolepyruvate oxidoreductase subunit beta [Candidatus Omnitrophota bacterium]MBU1869940.1 indolepyruvate oxidoreductase subunit beta [Candidatus Omnitrophota bacterium]